MSARVNSRASALATARYASVACGAVVGSPYQRNSCSRSSEMAPRPPPDVSERSAVLASSATAGSSRARVLSASASVIMRSVCPTRSSDERCVADLTGDVRVLSLVTLRQQPTPFFRYSERPAAPPLPPLLPRAVAGIHQKL